MRTADLKADTAYATCEGVMVVPLEPVHADYQVVREKGGDTTIVSLKEPDVPPTDPWGKCHTVKPKARHRVGTKGVKCAAYQVNRNGKRIEDTRREVVVKPADISGDWKTYLALYAHVVRAKADDREAERRTRAAVQSASMTLRSVPAEVSVSDTNGWGEGRYPAKTQVTFTFKAGRKGEEHLERLLDFARQVGLLYEGEAQSTRKKEA